MQRPPSSLPFFYGWIIVAVTFVTMALGVNARTAFSLFFAPVVDEFGWDRAVVAGAFSFGFVISAVLSPVMGRLMDRSGPRVVMELGVVLMAAGLLIAPLTTQPWHLYLTIGVLVGAGSVCLGYSGQSLFLPNWFVRKRGMAVGIAFAGVGVGSIILLPWIQTMINGAGWRHASLVLGLMILIILAPLNLLLRKKPEDMGLTPDGDAAPAGPQGPAPSNIVDPVWAATDWTLARAMKTGRFWWLSLGYFGGLYTWYAVQVHQTKYLVEIGFNSSLAAWALGFVSLLGIPGQIALGALSDRIGREWVWSIAQFGFVLCYAALMAMDGRPDPVLLWSMVAAQGLLGYGATSVMGAVVAEIFAGRHFGTIFGTVMFMGLVGGAAGPYVTGLLYDIEGSYRTGFAISLALGLVSAAAIWLAGPRKIRAVAGRVASV